MNWALSERTPAYYELINGLRKLTTEATDEADARWRNLQKLVHAALLYQEESKASDLEGFIASAALA